MSEESERRLGLLQLSIEKYTCEVRDIEVISAAAASGMKTVILVDVRSPPEQAVSMIPGALTRSEFEAAFPNVSLIPMHIIIAPYCTVGYRSGKYAQELVSRGLPTSQVRNHEGILAYTHTNQPLERKNLSTMEIQTGIFEVHTYAFPWSGLAHPNFREHYFGKMSSCSLV